MPLDFSKYNLTDEQIAEINAEIDRARTQASNTARTNAEKAFDEKLQAQVRDAVQRATVDANKTAEQKAADAWQEKFDQLSAALKEANDRNVKATNEAAIRRAGITDDAAVASFAEMFVSNPDGLSGFLDTYTSAVSAQVEIAKQKALGRATPPGGNPGGNSQRTNPTAMTQASISQLVKTNAENNGGYVDDGQLFADLRAMQTQH